MVDKNYQLNSYPNHTPSKMQFILRDFKKNKIFLVSFFYIIFIFLISIFIVLFSKSPNYQYGIGKFYTTNEYRLLGIFEKGFILGTDELSRSFLVRIAFGTFLSLSFAFINCFISIIIGFLYGFISGIKGKNIDMIMMYVVDVINSIPHIIIQILFGIVITRKLEYMFNNTICSLAALFLLYLLFDWLTFVITARNKTLFVKQQDYFNVSKSLGANDFFIIKKHLIPNCIDIIILSVTRCFIGTIISEASLSYLNIGIKKPYASLGTLIQTNKPFMNHVGKRFYFFIPITVFITIIIALNFINIEVRKIFKKRMNVYDEK